MLKIFSFLKQNVYIFLLFALTVVLFITNYLPGSYLLGWDSLSTEFAPFLGLQRAFWAGWQEYQSFGLVAGMGHSADLVRALFGLLLSFFVPVNLIRYVSHMFFIFVGILGMYKLLCLIFEEKHRILPFLGALFYLLNLGTVQMFSIPFEPFSVFFAMLPWEILVFLQYLHSHKILDKKKLLLLVLVNLLATPQSYVQTMFFVYILVLSCFSLGFLIEYKDRIFYIKKLFLAFLLIISVNLFWILPQVYFLATSYGVVESSKINQLATPDIFNRNKEKGNLASFVLMEGFYFDSVDSKGVLIFDSWHKFFNAPFIGYIRFIPFLLIFLGLFKFKKNHIGFVLVFILCGTALLNNSAVFSNFNYFIRSVGVLNQILRSPFTKFILIYSFVGSYLFVNGVEVFVHIFTRRYGLFFYILTVGFVLMLLGLSVPAFTGNFFAKTVKVELPSYYSDLFSYFKDVNTDKRIALLPEYTHWGWYKNNWGYDGSGFIWYGLKQPVVSRTFDVWSFKSESYYWEVKDALEDRDVDRFEKVLQKYNITYLLVDRDMIAISGGDVGLQYDQTDYVLSNSKSVVFVKSFGKIDLYEYKGNTTNNYVSVLTQAVSVGPLVDITDYDKAYLDNGNYFVQKKDPGFYYPFADLTTVTNLKNKKWKISETDFDFVLTADLTGLKLSDYSLILPQDDKLLTFKIYRDGYLEDTKVNITTSVTENTLSVTIPKIFVNKASLSDAEITNCSKLGSAEWESYFDSLHLTSSDRGRICVGYNFPLLQHWNSYIVKIDVENKQGLSPFVYIIGSKTKRQSKVEENLNNGANYVLLNPGNYYDDGYLLSFQNNSYMGMFSENRLFSSLFYLFPFDYLKSIRFDKNGGSALLAQEGTNIYKSYEYDVEKINYYTYKINIGSKAVNSVVGLDQSFSGGWVAVCGSELCKANHVVLNGWSNGWVFEGKVPEVIMIVYWPQYLQYIGLALGGLLVLFTLRK